MKRMPGALFALIFSISAFAIPAYGANPQVEITTNLGNVTLELDAEKAPRTVANFLQYVEAGYYDGTIFHRVIDGFMIQGGGYTADFKLKKPRAPIENEAGNGLKNRKGTIAMARTRDPHSANAQFFINVADNDFLDFRSPTTEGFGYAVFGRVSRGMDVVNRIAKAKTGPGGTFPGDVPQDTVTIQNIRKLGDKP
jgi:cyclophilin family peptidyl-prolyl cis-trans isomerase